MIVISLRPHQKIYGKEGLDACPELHGRDCFQISADNEIIDVSEKESPSPENTDRNNLNLATGKKGFRPQNHSAATEPLSNFIQKHPKL